MAMASEDCGWTGIEASQIRPMSQMDYKPQEARSMAGVGRQLGPRRLSGRISHDQRFKLDLFYWLVPALIAKYFDLYDSICICLCISLSLRR